VGGGGGGGGGVTTFVFCLFSKRTLLRKCHNARDRFPSHPPPPPSQHHAPVIIGMGAAQPFIQVSLLFLPFQMFPSERTATWIQSRRIATAYRKSQEQPCIMGVTSRERGGLCFSFRIRSQADKTLISQLQSQNKSPIGSVFPSSFH